MGCLGFHEGFSKEFNVSLRADKSDKASDCWSDSRTFKLGMSNASIIGPVGYRYAKPR